MRLRLRIERNGLPPTQALWPVKDTKISVAQLLQKINEVFPLEADTWGLEDYSVTVGGYECLHYHEIRETCKDEDEVVIQPLQWAERKARKLTGRERIAADGRHLVDGIPYGRPLLKSPARPDIVIPPTKRRKLLHETEAGEPITLREGLDESDEEDGDFNADSSSVEDASSEEEIEDSSRSESDEDTSASEEDSSNGSESESEDAESWSGLSPSEPPTPQKRGTTTALKLLPSSNSTPGTSNSSKRKRTLSNSKEYEEGKAIQNTRQNIPSTSGRPFEGSPVTKSRNARRREQNKLKYLKQEHGLPSSITLAMMRQWELDGKDLTALKESVVDSTVDATSAATEKNSAKKDGASTEQPPLVEASVTVPETQTTKTGTKKAKKTSTIKADKKTADKDMNDADFEKKRAKLLRQIQSGGVDVTDEVDAGSAQTTDEKTLATEKSAPVATATRSRLDLAGSRRLVFGSLGVRVPKTQAEKDELQKKLADRQGRIVNADQGDSPGANGLTTVRDASQEMVAAEENLESWREKINLTAVECCDEGVTFSTPPFPFHQRWDPQQRKKKANKRANGTYMEVGGKKRKRGEFVETYDKYNTNGGGDVLDYDGDQEEEYWEEGALLNEDNEAEGQDQDDGFPPLPADIDTLPLLNETEAKTGDFITFNELACDESTSWQPKTMTRTAQIVETPVPGALDWMLLLSARDRTLKAFDDDGNRIYSKFEMPDADEGDDEGNRLVEWNSLGPVRLVCRMVDKAE